MFHPKGTLVSLDPEDAVVVLVSNKKVLDFGGVDTKGLPPVNHITKLMILVQFHKQKSYVELTNNA